MHVFPNYQRFLKREIRVHLSLTLRSSSDNIGHSNRSSKQSRLACPLLLQKTLLSIHPTLLKDLLQRFIVSIIARPASFSQKICNLCMTCMAQVLSDFKAVLIHNDGTAMTFSGDALQSLSVLSARMIAKISQSILVNGVNGSDTLVELLKTCPLTGYCLFALILMFCPGIEKE